MTGWIFPACLIVLLGLGAAAAHADTAGDTVADEPTPAATAAAPDADRALTVAVLSFDTRETGDEGLADVLEQTLTIMLAGQPGLELVDRASLEDTLAEHELNLTGLVDTNQAVRVGQIVGARILITGSAFQLGDQAFMTAKIIGTETTRVDGVLVQDEIATGLDQLVMTLAHKLAQRVAEVGPRLVASDRSVDPLPRMTEALAGRDLPSVAVVVREEHLRRQRPAAVPDPAVETELKRTLRQAGLTVHDVDANALVDWTRHEPWPRQLTRVDVVITGEAFSEFGVQIGNLHSAAARAEINVIDRATGEILIADRATTRAVDLAENIAGKSALEIAGRQLGIRVLEHLVATLPPPQEPDAAGALDE
ncbi:MAG: hypothetical protein WD009_05015 [Phycisphaeraceae bacterium]